MKREHQEKYGRGRVTASEAVGRIKAGRRVFIGSFCGEPQHLVSALFARPEAYCDVEVVRMLNLEGSLLGLVADETGGRSYHARSIYQGSGSAAGFTAARRFLTPINLYAVPRLFQNRTIPLHFALVQVSPPDDFGWMNLGPSVDITLAAAQSAEVVIAQVNPKVPRVPGRGFVHVNDVDLFVEHEEDLLASYSSPDLPGTEAIARYLSNVIEDGSTIQASPGFTPNLLLSALGGKRDLGVHSQFIVDAVAELAERGVITNRKKGCNDGKIVAGGAMGSPTLFRFLDGNPAVEFRPSDYVSNPSVIARHERMVALNLATAMDLRGQVAADASACNHFSDVAGMVDFCRGASMAPGGKSIIVIPSVAPGDLSGNIIAELSSGAVAVSANDVTYVVSEYGLVNLSGKNAQERAMAMISISHPSSRERLFQEARALGLIGKDRTLTESLFGVYPAWLEEAVELGGERVTLRPAKPGDERLIQEHFYEMEMEDVAHRFFGPRHHFYWDEVGRMFMADYVTNFTVVAFVGEVGFGRVVGLGSYYREPGKDMAEIAYSVSRDFQGKGLAGNLQRKTVEAALGNGLAGLFGITNTENDSMIKLFRKLPYKVTTSYEDGEVKLYCRFDDPA